MTREEAAGHDEEMLFADGFDEALVGVVMAFGRPPLACYSVPKMVDVLVRDGLTYEEAMEHLDFNVFGAWVGERTPVYLWPEELN